MGSGGARVSLIRTSRVLAVIHLPITLAVISKTQHAVPGIMELAAPGTFQITAPSGAVMIVVFSDRKRRAATAGHEKHLQARSALRKPLGF
jgi:hypothetical protein